MQIQPIGVPYDLNRYDYRMGRTPAYVLPRLVSLSALNCADPIILQIDDLTGDEQHDLALILAALGRKVRRTREQGMLPLIVGGDCMVSLGVMAGLEQPASIVWIDAHGDFNTPATTPSGYLGGMPLAIIAGRGLEALRVGAGLAAPIPEGRIVLLGLRDLDPPERTALEHSAVTLFATQQLRDDSASVDTVLARIGQMGPIYLHLDVDVLGPAAMPGVVYPAPNGLHVAELVALLQRIRTHCTLAAFALTALNLDDSNRDQALETALTLLRAMG
jgi:arginase